MTPEHQFNKIIEHLEQLQNLTLELNTNLQDISQTHTELSHPDSEIHPDITQGISDMHSILSEKMNHTEQMVQNILHPDRIDHLSNFMNVLNDALTPPDGEE